MDWYLIGAVGIFALLLVSAVAVTLLPSPQEKIEEELWDEYLELRTTRLDQYRIAHDVLRGALGREPTTRELYEYLTPEEQPGE